MGVLQVRVVAVIGDEVHRHVEVALGEAVEEELRLELLVVGLDADALPLVDDENADGRIGLADVAVVQLDGEVFDAGLFQKPSRFRA